MVLYCLLAGNSRIVESYSARLRVMVIEHRNEILAEVAELVSELQHRRLDDDSLLRDLPWSAVKFLPGGQYASITVVHGEAIETFGATHCYVVSLDEIQQEHQEGPACRRRGSTTSWSSTTWPLRRGGHIIGLRRWSAPRYAGQLANTKHLK